RRIYVFVSSRRRHTRFSRDWSSDVCSSDLPHVSGVNNHMGSKATADPRVVSDVLRAVKEAGLFFLDSRTTADSVVAQVARELGEIGRASWRERAGDAAGRAWRQVQQVEKKK